MFEGTRKVDVKSRMVSSKERESMKRILIIASIIMTLRLSYSKAEIQVIQVRRNIPLSDEEPVYKDYYLSGGGKAGLKENLVVPVFRWVILRENSQAPDQALKVLEPVGWLKIIYVQDQIGVARLHKGLDPKVSPIQDIPGIMMGDLVHLEKSYLADPGEKAPPDSLQKAPEEL